MELIFYRKISNLMSFSSGDIFDEKPLKFYEDLEILKEKIIFFVEN